MKTKIRTFIAMVALGVIGFTNINATVDFKSEFNAIHVTEKEESLTIESWMIENEYWTLEQGLTIEPWMIENDFWTLEKGLTIESWMIENDFWTPKSEIETQESDKALKIEDWMTEEELFIKSAESYTAAGVDREIEKYADKQVSLVHTKNRK